MPTTTVESKRVKAFRLGMAKQIPKFPNDKATLKILENKPLTGILIDYMNWRLRYVRQTARKVRIKQTAIKDPRWSLLSKEISAFLQKVRAGEDLTPYLSIEPHTRGFTPTARTESRSRWADKDLLLNVMGLHHFHLGMTREKSGHMSRTDDILFASVSRDLFEVIGIFNHAVFEQDDPSTMTNERKRLWQIFEDQEKRNALPGALTFGGFGGVGVTTSAHPVVLVRAAQRYAKCIKEIDPKLENKSFLQKIFLSNPAPPKPKFTWCFKSLDLGILEITTSSFFIFQKGPN